nr:spindle and kinetochore-associated protein 1 homolog [Tanacetum cinerariifolium]
MEGKKQAAAAGSSLDSLISSFNTRIAELQDLVVARNMYPASSVTDLSAVDSTLKSLEMQLQQIKDRLREETLAIPKAKLGDIIHLILNWGCVSFRSKYNPIVVKFGLVDQLLGDSDLLGQKSATRSNFVKTSATRPEYSDFKYFVYV